jgi:hypothetical protein
MYQCCPALQLSFDVKCGMEGGFPIPRCVDGSGGSTQAMSLDPANGTLQWAWNSNILVSDGLALLPDGVILLGTAGKGSSGESPNSVIRLTVSSGGPETGAPYHGTTGELFSFGAVAMPDGSIYAQDGLSLYRWNASGPPVWAMASPKYPGDFNRRRFSGTPALSPRADILYLALNPTGFDDDAKLIALNLSRL